MGEPELVDLTLQLHHETDRAILVSDDGDAEKAVWLAKSQIEFELKSKGIVDVTCPIWLAKERRLI
ncbi:MAG: hypothetical protein ACREF8_01730 [Chthoniobacterales bacterium]